MDFTMEIGTHNKEGEYIVLISEKSIIPSIPPTGTEIIYRNNILQLSKVYFDLETQSVYGDVDQYFEGEFSQQDIENKFLKNGWKIKH